MPRHPDDIARTRSIVDDYESGMTQVEVAARYGVTQQRVSAILHSEGAHVRAAKRRDPKIPLKKQRVARY